MKPGGLLRERAGWTGGWQWTCDGEKVASINLRAEQDRLRLAYRVRVSGGDWKDVAETVRIVRVACRFGGARPPSDSRYPFSLSHCPGACFSPRT